LHQHVFVCLRQDPELASVIDAGHLLVHVHVWGPQIRSTESLRTVPGVQGVSGTVHYRNGAGVDFPWGDRLHLLSLLQKPKVCADHQGELLRDWLIKWKILRMHIMVPNALFLVVIFTLIIFVLMKLLRYLIKLCQK